MAPCNLSNPWFTLEMSDGHKIIMFQLTLYSSLVEEVRQLEVTVT